MGEAQQLNTTMEQFEQLPREQLYEVMFIVPGTLNETDAAAVQARALEFIAQYEGKVAVQYNMGRRKLAYIIKQQRHGYYMVVQFNANPDNVLEIDTKLRLDGEILRHLITKADPMTAEELELMIEGTPEEREEREEREAAYEAKQQEAKQPKVEKAEAPEAPAKEEAPKEVEADDVAGALPATEEAAPEAPAKEEVKEEAPAEEAKEEKAEEAAPEADATTSGDEDLDKKLDAILEDADIQEKL